MRRPTGTWPGAREHLGGLVCKAAKDVRINPAARNNQELDRLGGLASAAGTLLEAAGRR